ncbi:MAG: Ppx/GppA phosphatase family protein [Candidatus Nanopelagicales bacterium]
MKIAAIDCGTNSIRLLIMDYQKADQSLTEIIREMRIVRLGEGVDQTKSFSEAALTRTKAAIEEYAKHIEHYSVEKIRFVATSATRDANNRDIFFVMVKKALGIEAEVITGEEEAALSFAGATRSLASKLEGPFLVIDLGGGSTELVVGQQTPTTAYSMNVGCVRMTERHAPGGNPTDSQEQAIRADVRAALAAAREKVDFSNVKTVIGVAGTVTTVAAHALKIDKYDPNVLHGAAISSQQVSQTAVDFIKLSLEERAALPYMHPGRVEVITAGAIVLDEIIKEIKANKLIASERDILDGVAWSIVA